MVKTLLGINPCGRNIYNVPAFGGGTPSTVVPSLWAARMRLCKNKGFGIYITSMLKPWGHTRGCCYFGPSILNCFEFALDGIFHFIFFGTEIPLMSSMTWPCHMWCDPLRKCGGHETAWWRLHDAWLDGLQPHVGMNLQDVHKTSIGWWNFEGEPWWQPLCEIFM